MRRPHSATVNYRDVSLGRLIRHDTKAEWIKHANGIRIKYANDGIIVMSTTAGGV